jgi:type VI secretion system protein ImpA
MFMKKLTLNKKQVASKTFESNTIDPILQPISDEQPCGENIEYDPQYLQLQAKLTPQFEVQYGDFVSRPPGLNWADIENECRKLLSKSKDINVLIWFMRCRTQRAGTVGFAYAFELLLNILYLYPDDVYPQPLVDGKIDLYVRANALAGLTDNDGILSDLRTTIVFNNAVESLTTRDIEKALSGAPPSIKEAERVKLMLADLIQKNSPAVMPLINAKIQMERLQTWTSKTMGDNAPTFTALQRLLAPYQLVQTEEATQHASMLQKKALSQINTDNFLQKNDALMHNTITHFDIKTSELDKSLNSIEYPSTNLSIPSEVANDASGQISRGVRPSQQRELIKQQIQTLMTWFNTNEPSSPVYILLNYAQMLVGKNYLEISKTLPLDLLEKCVKEMSISDKTSIFKDSNHITET